MPSQHPYRMRVVPEALLHLGEGLYSNVPAVISEIVANAWDADATEVRIEVDTEARTIAVHDNGSGMDLDDINEKYLIVGYNRREKSPGRTPVWERDPMGRKGIGKLSLFSIAPEAEVHTAKRQEGDRIEKHGFLMTTKGMREATASGRAEYEPTPLTPEAIGSDTGTLIRLRNVRVGNTTVKALRRQLARRFSVIDPALRFSVFVDDTAISVEERGFFQSIQYLWEVGGSKGQILPRCSACKRNEFVEGEIDPEKGYEVHGWIGTFSERKQLGKEDNAITILARGKLLEEDILSYFDEGGMYTKYVVGELHADFFDRDELEDIATSDRQSVKQHDERFTQLVDWLRPRLKRIESVWGGWREKDATEEAVEEFPVIKKWMDGLSTDHRRYAETLFGKIGAVAKQDKDARAELYRHAIVAFHTLALRQSLTQLDGYSAEDMSLVASIIADLDALEIIHYGHIVQGRFSVLKKLEELVDQNAKEKFLQEHVYDHLWLLHPSWERATADERMETKVTEAFSKVTAKLSDAERRARIDIYYRTAAGTHIVVELKRSGVAIDVMTLVRQLSKYRSALRKVLEEANQKAPSIKCVALTGKPLTGDGVDIPKQLESVDAVSVTYEQLITETRANYGDFIEANRELKKMDDLVAELQLQASKK